MASNDGLLHFASVDELAVRGQPIEGVIEVTGQRDVRGVRVELVRTQVSQSTSVALVDVVAEQEVAGAAALAGGERFGFSIRVPEDAVPGFATPHGSLAWSLRARADVLGGDPTRDHPITIAEIPAGRPASGLLEAPALDLVALATRKRTQADQRNAFLLGIVFLAAAVLFVVLGIVRTGGEHPGAARWASFGFAALFFVLGTVAVGQRWRASHGMSATTDAVAYRPGGTVIVTATNPTRRTCTIGLQALEVRSRVQGSGRNTRHDAPQHELAGDWRDLPPGDHRMTFTVPADTPGSFGGRTIAVAHRVAIFHHGKHAAGTRALSERHIVVLR